MLDIKKNCLFRQASYVLAIGLLISSVGANFNNAPPKTNLVGEKNALPDLAYHSITTLAPFVEPPVNNNPPPVNSSPPPPPPPPAPPAPAPAAAPAPANNLPAPSNPAPVNNAPLPPPPPPPAPAPVNNPVVQPTLAPPPPPAPAVVPLTTQPPVPIVPAEPRIGVLPTNAPVPAIIAVPVTTKAPVVEHIPVKIVTTMLPAPHTNIALTPQVAELKKVAPEFVDNLIHRTTSAPKVLLVAPVVVSTTKLPLPANLMPPAPEAPKVTAAPAVLTGIAVTPKAAVLKDTILGAITKNEAKSDKVLPTLVLEAKPVKDPLHKFCDYLKPICTSLEKLNRKHLAKIQTQMKQIVELTKGKLGTCFLDHYMFNPAMNAITMQEVRSICASKHLDAKLKGSYKSFESCAVKNWSPLVDAELDRIQVARVNCAKNHKHAGNETTVVGLTHGEEEISIINEVVSKVLEGDKSALGQTNIKVIEFASLGSALSTAAPKGMRDSLPSVAPVKVPTSVAPTSPGLAVPTTTKAPHAASSSAAPITSVKPAAAVSSTVSPAGDVRSSVSSMIKDPNTVLVFVDDNSKTTQSLIKVLATEKPVAAKTTVAPASKVALKSSTSKPATTTDKPTTTSLPIAALIAKETAAGAEAAKEALKEVLKEAKEAKEAKEKELKKDVKKPAKKAGSKKESLIKKIVASLSTVPPKASSKSTAGKSKTVSKIVSKLAAGKSEKKSAKSSSTNKPLATLEEVLKRQEKEKMALEKKLRLEREKLMKMLQKKQDAIDAQNAIRSLQMQRDHKSDNKLHQLEHERQMSIDPIGHTLKHQQYELNKQQKLLSSKS